MKTYFEASIRQHLKRGEYLVGSIPRPTDLPQEFHRLVQTVNEELVHVLEELEFLLNDSQIQSPDYQPERLRRFRRAVQQLNILESTCVAALTRHHSDDGFLTRLVMAISNEIKYPLLPPIVTSLSKQYFHIYPLWNLMFVPLSEGAFLLHLPDLYHELAHPLITTRFNPRLKPFQGALWEVLGLVFSHIADEKQREKRGRGPRRVSHFLKLWEQSWIDWTIEFFCDLFAIYTLGPAFAWSHVHLCTIENANPFRVPIFQPSSHPADHARMHVMLYGLRLIGFDLEADAIEDSWNKLVTISGAKIEPEYQRCFPEHILESIAQKGYEGVFESQFRIVSQDTDQPIHNALNEAWTVFWTVPKGYTDWEEKTVRELRQIS